MEVQQRSLAIYAFEAFIIVIEIALLTYLGNIKVFWNIIIVHIDYWIKWFIISSVLNSDSEQPLVQSDSAQLGSTVNFDSSTTFTAYSIQFFPCTWWKKLLFYLFKKLPFLGSKNFLCFHRIFYLKQWKIDFPSCSTFFWNSSHLPNVLVILFTHTGCLRVKWQK